MKKQIELYYAPKDVVLVTGQTVQEIGTFVSQPVYMKGNKYYTFSKMQMRLFPIAKSKLGL